MGWSSYHHADGEEVGVFPEPQAVLFILCKTWHLSMKILIMSFSDQFLNLFLRMDMSLKCH